MHEGEPSTPAVQEEGVASWLPGRPRGGRRPKTGPPSAPTTHISLPSTNPLAPPS